MLTLKRRCYTPLLLETMYSTPKYQSVTVRVPASTANLGPGFDCLGMALGLWNQVQLQWGGPMEVILEGEGSDRIPKDKRNLTYRAAQRVMSELGVSDAEFCITAHQEVPLSRGLGSSSCAIVGGLVAANALFDDPIPTPRLLEIAAEIEGHPDNVAAALLGGCCIVVQEGNNLQAAQVPLPTDLQCVVYIPDQPMPTRQARAVLPLKVSRRDALFNIGRTALLINALATGRPEYLRIATQDRLHQPPRQNVFPAMKYIFAGALQAGAKAVFLSGAGSSILALTMKPDHRALTIGYEMADAGDKAHAPGTFLVLEPSPTGAEVLERVERS